MFEPITCHPVIIHSSFCMSSWLRYFWRHYFRNLQRKLAMKSMSFIHNFLQLAGIICTIPGNMFLPRLQTETVNNPGILFAIPTWTTLVKMTSQKDVSSPAGNVLVSYHNFQQEKLIKLHYKQLYLNWMS